MQQIFGLNRQNPVYILENCGKLCYNMGVRRRLKCRKRDMVSI